MRWGDKIPLLEINKEICNIQFKTLKLNGQFRQPHTKLESRSWNAVYAWKYLNSTSVRLNFSPRVTLVSYTCLGNVKLLCSCLHFGISSSIWEGFSPLIGLIQSPHTQPKFITKHATFHTDTEQQLSQRSIIHPLMWTALQWWEPCRKAQSDSMDPWGGSQTISHIQVVSWPPSCSSIGMGTYSLS